MHGFLTIDNAMVIAESKVHHGTNNNLTVFCDRARRDGMHPKNGRLRREARHVYVENTPLPAISDMSIGHAMEFFNNLKLAGQRAKIAEKILKEIGDRLKFLVNVGLNYLTLSRSAETLSGGEAQRIRLASQIGAGLVGVMYVLDEPSIGLHQRDNERLLGTLIHLRDLGNTVIVVEHDEDPFRPLAIMLFLVV